MVKVRKSDESADMMPKMKHMQRQNIIGFFLP